MSANPLEQASSTIEPAEVQQALEKILNSKHFVNAQKKKRFLRLISDFYLEGRAHELNEYILGYDVFGRDSNYNPSADPIVRVVAHDIRKKLKMYYENEGANDAIRLDLPRAAINLSSPDIRLSLRQKSMRVLLILFQSLKLY